MDDKTGAGHKPLRSTSNKIKDIYNTYLRNEETRAIPITEPDNARAAGEDLENDNQSADAGNDEVPAELEEFSGDIGSLSEEIEKLNKLVLELEIERDELKEQAMRRAAEVENIRRRSQREKNEMLDYANEKLLFKLLETYDDIYSAIDAGEKSNDYHALLTGIKMIFQKFSRLFDDNGVKRIENPVGKQFNVEFHEAVGLTPSDMPEGAVVYEVQPGYLIKDKVLRHTKVIASAGKQESNNQNS